jgi:ABC-type multidrug transport system ATPase subunit
LQVIRSGGLLANSGKVTYSLLGEEMNDNPISNNPSGKSVRSNRSHFVVEEGDSPIDGFPSANINNDLEGNTSLIDNEHNSFHNKNNTKRTLLPEELSKYVGYVPQEDILDRQLTVRELLLFHATTRLANQQIFDSSFIQETVKNAMIELNIFHIQDAIIGGNENMAANISGGQLKRVNIACELVALSSPAVLLLDEPTSGLDANIAYELVESLSQLKKAKNITIFMVLQQPRSEIFQLMNRLFLMGPNGALVYEGEIHHVSQTLMGMGYVPYAIETSDADFCIDILNQMKYENEIHIIEKEFEDQGDAGGSGNLLGRPSSHHQSSLLDADFLMEDQILSLFSVKYYMENSMWKGSWKMITNPVFYLFIYLNMKRLLKIRLRNNAQLLVYISLNVIMATALATGFSIFMTDSFLSVLTPPVPADMQDFYPSALENIKTHNSDQFSFTQLIFFLCATLGCSSCLTAVPVFAGNRNVALREKYSGISISAYGIGRMLADLPFVFMTSMVFAGVWCCFGMAGSYDHWMATCFFTAYAASGIGYVAGVSSSGYNANVYSIIMTFICCVFSGSEPSLAQVSKYPVISWPWYLSFGTWTSEAAYVTWSDYLTNDGNIPNNLQQGADTYGYDVTNGLTRSVCALFAIGTGLRMIVLIVLNKI